MADIRAAVMTTPNPRQQRVLDAIREYWRNAGIPPTLRELCDATRSSSTSVMADDVAALASLGLVRMTPGIARSIMLVQPDVPPMTKTDYDTLMEALNEYNSARGGLRVLPESVSARRLVQAWWDARGCA